MLRMVTTGLISAAVGGALLLSAPASVAGDTMPRQLAQTQPQNYSEEKLEAYAEAANEVIALNTQWQQRIQQTQNPQQVQQMQQQATEELTQAIQDQGLTLQEYNQITRVAQQDSEMRGKITELMQDAR